MGRKGGAMERPEVGTCPWRRALWWLLPPDAQPFWQGKYHSEKRQMVISVRMTPDRRWLLLWLEKNRKLPNVGGLGEDSFFPSNIEHVGYWEKKVNVHSGISLQNHARCTVDFKNQLFTTKPNSTNQMMLASVLHSGQDSKLGGKWAGKLPGEYKAQMCWHEP